jgi:MFS family permease
MRLYAAGQTLSFFGDTALWLALAVWAKTLTGSSAAAGMVIFGITAPGLLAPLSGLLADRVRRRPLLIVTNLAMAAAVLALVFVHDRGDVWIIYAVTVAYGFSYTVLGAGLSGLLTTILPPDELADANGLMQTARESLRLLAPLIGAGLFSAAGGAAVAMLDAVTFVCAAVAIALMRVKEPAPEPRSGRFVSEIAAGAKHLRATIPLRQLTVASGVALLVIGFSETLTFEVAGTGLGKAPSFVGVILAVQGVGAVIGGLTAARLVRRVGEGHVAGLGMIVFSLGVTGLTSGSLPVVLAGIVLFGLGIPWVVVALFTLLQRLTPAPLQGRTYSAVEVFVNTPQTVSIALGATLVAMVDYRLLLAVEAAVVAGAGAWLLTRPDQRVATPH